MSRRRGATAPPWLRDPNCLYAFEARPKYLGMTGAQDDGTVITSIKDAIGETVQLTNVGASGTKTYRRTFNGTAASQSVEFNVTTSTILSNITIASPWSGTAKAFSFCIALRLPQAPNYAGAAGAVWSLFTLTRQSVATSVFYIVGTRSAGSTTCWVQRTNDAGVAQRGANMSLGTTGHVIEGTWDATNGFNTWLDGTQIDTNATGGGGSITLDTLTLGGFCCAPGGVNTITQWSDPIYRFAAFGNGNRLPYTDYLLRNQ